MTSADFVAGVDAGATTIRAGVGDGHGNIAARATAQSVRLADGAGQLAGVLAHTVRGALSAVGAAGPTRALVVGAAGAGDERAAAALEDALVATAVAKRLAVVTDAELVLADAFGDGAGIALIAGTGSIAMARLPSGDVARAGGLGPETGDPGSGYAIGRAATRVGVHQGDTSLLRLVMARLKLRDLSELATWADAARPAAVAALAPTVLRQAAAGDTTARPIVEAAVVDLAALVSELAERFDAREVALATAGGLCEDPGFRRLVEAAAVARSPRVRPLAGNRDPVRGALWLAARLAGSERP